MTEKALDLKPTQQTLPTVEPARAMTPMDLIYSMVQHGVDAEQLDKMLTLQERWEANEARKAFAAAMADFQARCPTIFKARRADRYNYAPLDEILRTIRPHLEACGLSVRFSTRLDGQIITTICTVSHRDGHSEISEFAAPVDPNMKVNETQKVGSANSYAKRYALSNALGLVASDEDDDGYSAGSVCITDQQAAANPPPAQISDATFAELSDYIEAISDKMSPEQSGYFTKHPIEQMTEDEAQAILKRMKKRYG